MSADEKTPLDSRIGAEMRFGTSGFESRSLTKVFEKSSCGALVGLGCSSMAWAEVAAELGVNVKISERRGNSCRSLIYLWVGRVEIKHSKSQRKNPNYTKVGEHPLAGVL